VTTALPIHWPSHDQRELSGQVKSWYGTVTGSANCHKATFAVQLFEDMKEDSTVGYYTSGRSSKAQIANGQRKPATSGTAISS
jgi:hypothetical protein